MIYPIMRSPYVLSGFKFKLQRLSIARQHQQPNHLQSINTNNNNNNNTHKSIHNININIGN